MFHKNVANSIRSLTTLSFTAANDPQQSSGTAPRLQLVPSGGGGFSGPIHTQTTSSALVEFIAISAHRCSAFFAEAAVLVLVLALLDRFMLKGRMEFGWIFSAVTISLSLLAASIVTDYFARRWLKAH
jgi:hypothetical protein